MTTHVNDLLSCQSVQIKPDVYSLLFFTLNQVVILPIQPRIIRLLRRTRRHSTRRKLTGAILRIPVCRTRRTARKTEDWEVFDEI